MILCLAFPLVHTSSIRYIYHSSFASNHRVPRSRSLLRTQTLVCLYLRTCAVACFRNFLLSSYLAVRVSDLIPGSVSRPLVLVSLFAAPMSPRFMWQIAVGPTQACRLDISGNITAAFISPGSPMCVWRVMAMVIFYPAKGPVTNRETNVVNHPTEGKE